MGQGYTYRETVAKTDFPASLAFSWSLSIIIISMNSKAFVISPIKIFSFFWGGPCPTYFPYGTPPLVVLLKTFCDIDQNCINILSITMFPE